MSPAFEQEIYELHSRLCAGLADPKRILILYALAERKQNVTELSERLGIAQPTVSRHLKLLRDRNLVVAEREGQAVFYAISDRRVIQALDLLRAVLADMLRSQAGLANSFTEHSPTTSPTQESE